MLTPRLLVMALAGLISVASFVLQGQPPATDVRIAALETSQATLKLRVGALETVVKSVLNSPGKPSPVTPTPKSAEKIYEILSIDTKVTESNNTYSQWAWILKVANYSDKTIVFSARIKFLDEDGFVVDEDYARNLVLDPGETKSFNGAKLVTAEIAPSIDRISAETEVTSSR